MGVKYLLDTNSVIDYLGNKLPISALEIIDSINVFVSIVSKIELLAWPKATEEHLQILQLFLHASTVQNLDENIVLKTIELRKMYKIKLPDAIIAATAIVFDLVLITHNLKDFRRIKELKCVDSYLLGL